MEEIVGVIPEIFTRYGNPEVVKCVNSGRWYLKYRLSDEEVALLNSLYGYDEGNQWELIPLDSPRMK